MSAVIQVNAVLTNLKNYQYYFSDVISILIVIVFVVANLIFVVLIYTKQEELKDEKSNETEKYGRLIKDINIKKLPISVTILASIFSFIENVFLVFMLVGESDKAWL